MESHCSNGVGANYGEIKIFACNSNIPLAEGIVASLKKITQLEKCGEQTGLSAISLGSSEIGKFEDGEISLKINESMRECDVFIIQSVTTSDTNSVNDNLMELLIMIDACKRASAKRITAVIPYYGYSRQDRKVRARDPISAKLVANLITSAGADRVLTMDLHSAQIQGFFDKPLDNLMGLPIFGRYYQEKFVDRENLIVVSPDLGSVARGRALAEKLKVKLAIVDKRREDESTEVLNIIGKVKGKRAILIDDEIGTGGSITSAAQALQDHGTTEIYACCTHGKFASKAIEKIENSPILELVALDTIPLHESKKIDKIKQLSVDEVFARAIFRIHEGMSVSDLFN